MPRRRGTRDDLLAPVDINVTSLVDVAFTLLVIFIIAAPALQGGVEVALPRAEARPIAKPDAVVVTLDAGGRLYLGDEPVAWDGFHERFAAELRRTSARGAYLRADGNVPYAQVLRVLGAMNAAGPVEVGLIAEPERLTP